RLPRRPRSPRAQPGPGGRQAPPPTPVPTTQIDLQLIPDLRAGRVGWCVDVSIQAAGMSAGHRGCTPAGPAGTMVISTGGLPGTVGAGYAIVDEAVTEIRLSDGRRITPEVDPDIPPQWRSASWPVNGALPTFTLHDFAGAELPPIRTAPLDPLRTRRVSAANPPRRRCAMRASGNLRATSARLVTRTIGAQDAVDPSYVACASTVYRIGESRLRASVLLDARSPAAIAPDLPSVGGAMSVRRDGRGLLAVYGGTAAQRERVLQALTVRGP
ncbi:hypothetical protein OJ998_10765, partial [Solirubrobacter taibaiensis]|nr:hypothetical protein [Solirubrobacter taibaiensis]